MPRHACKKCGREFQSSRALSSHMRDKHPSIYYSRRLAVIGLAVALAASAFLGLVYSGALTQPATQPRELSISGIRCDSLEQTTYHVHMLLEIYADGEKRTIPRNIGIIQGVCLYWLHTHDETGVIHIEAPSRGRYTLGQFFDIWGQPLTSEKVWDMDLTGGKRLRVYVDGEPYAGDPRGIELLDGRVIALDVGPPFRFGG